MSRPLQSRRKLHNEKHEGSLWANPYIIGLIIACLVFLGALFLHNYSSGFFSGNDSTISSSNPAKKSAYFSFLNLSSLFKKNKYDVNNADLEDVGIPSGTRSVFADVKPENYREKRRLFALQKYEGIRQAAKQKQDAIAEFQKQRAGPTAMNLKEAVTALSEMDNLGIMKLESLLNDALIKRGGSRDNLDVLIFAYQNLAEVYTKKNMKQKAKDAYLNAFHLMKEMAPESEGADWANTISEVEKIDVKAPGN